MTPLLLAFGGREPKLADSVFVANGACVIGEVVVGENSSIWFNSVVRGDVNWIRIGERTNIQDNSVLHVTHGLHPLSVGSDVTIGHRSILHGCTIEDGCLIGMGAIVLDGARVRKNAMVAAGSLVLAGFEVPEGVLVAGVPASIKRPLTVAEREGLWQSAKHYVEYAKSYHSTNY
jgi:carbonic anhydrase/acetyltransferase-like protein (isoleucine patch superfamily)